MTSPLSPEMKDDDHLQKALRPQSFKDFVGQDGVLNNLKTFIKAAKERGKPLDHVLLSGPPGLGKTSLAHLMAHEMNVMCHTTSGASIARSGELAALLTNLKPGDILFIDEIHRLNKTIEEILYPALEDGCLDLMVGEGPGAHSVRLTLSPFTLVGATTRQGLLSRPLRDRFGILGQMSFYTPEALGLILERAASKSDILLEKDAFHYLAQRARGTPRIALRLLRRIHDFALVHKPSFLDEVFVEQCLKALGVDSLGLDSFDQRYVTCLYKNFQGGPVGIDTLAAALFEERTTLEEVIEPFLTQKGFIRRTPRGRVLGQKAYEHFGWPQPHKPEATGHTTQAFYAADHEHACRSSEHSLKHPMALSTLKATDLKSNRALAQEEGESFESCDPRLSQKAQRK